MEDDGLWTEFLYLPARDYPTILAAVDEDLLGLPVLHFFESGLPNGGLRGFSQTSTPRARAGICATTTAYTPGDPREFSVDTVGGAGGTDQHEEYSLGTVSITDGNLRYLRAGRRAAGRHLPLLRLGLDSGWWRRVPGGDLHYITERHADGEDHQHRQHGPWAGITLPGGATSLATAGQPPLPHRGRQRAGPDGAVGQLRLDVQPGQGARSYNLDDLVWRSIVWAARKPS